MQENRTEYTSRPTQYQSPSQFSHTPYPGFNRAPQPSQYSQKAAIVIGIIQIIIGITCVVMNSVLIRFGDPKGVSIIPYGICGGIMFINAGLVQVSSGINVPNKCLIIAAMVMCIIGTCISPVVIALGIADAILGGVSWASCGYRNRYCYYSSSPLIHLKIGSVMAILAFIEAVISIIGSAYCCAGLCCISSNKQNPFPNQSTLSEMAYTPQTQVTINPGLASDPPPFYSPDWIAENKSS